MFSKMSLAAELFENGHTTVMVVTASVWSVSLASVRRVLTSTTQIVPSNDAVREKSGKRRGKKLKSCNCQKGGESRGIGIEQALSETRVALQ